MSKLHSAKTTQSITEARLRALFKGNPIPIYLWQQQSDDFILLDYNDAAEAITKGNIVKILNQPLSTLYQDRPKIVANVWDCFNQKTVIKQTMLYRLISTGETKEFVVSYVFVPPDMVMVHTEDLTAQKRVEELLRQSESRLTEAQQIAKMGNWDWNIGTNKLHWSDEIYRIFGLEPQQFEATYQAFLETIHPQDRTSVTTAVEQALAGKAPYNLDHRIVLPNGQTRVVHEQANVTFDQQGRPIRMAGIVQDITERKHMEEELRIKDNAIASALNGIALGNLKGELTYVNDSFLQLWGYNSALEVLGKSSIDFWRAPQEAEAVVQIITEQGKWSGEMIALKKDGSEMTVQLSASMITNEANQPVAIMAAFTDITARKQAEEQLKASLQEKEVLLKEIHHRVKNNLQIVSSLLDLQSSYVEDERAQKIFLESKNRIKSMAMVHEWLYHTDNLATVNFTDYVDTLTAYLFRAFGRRSVDIQQTLAPVYLSLGTAISCGLIINELVSNALKYAFPHCLPDNISASHRPRPKTCRINIELHANQDVAAPNNLQLSLLVKDNGVGLPPDFDIDRSPSLGLTLVVTLVKQLKGVMEIGNQNGAEFRITFTDPAASIAPAETIV